MEAGEGSVGSRRMWWWGSPGAERGGAEGRDGWMEAGEGRGGEERGVSPRSGDDAGVGWGGVGGGRREPLAASSSSSCLCTI